MTRLGQNLVDNASVDIGKTETPPLQFESELFVIDA